MIRLSKLPKNVLTKIPELIKILKSDGTIVAFYTFGSAASGNYLLVI
jgi:predicted nucleotidyltransferase